MRLCKFLERSRLAAACVAREHAANLMAENKRAERLYGLEGAGLNDTFVRPELGAFGFRFKKVLYLRAD